MNALTARALLVRRRLATALATSALLVPLLGGCAALDPTAQDGGASAATVETTGTVWDATTVHEFALDLDEEDFQAMVATYVDTGEKEWIAADVTIDGRTIRDVGVRLKGYSSLRGVSADADPADLPWLIDLDKYVDGQSLDGSERFVIRSNTSETSLNEAVALDLLQEAGLASTDAVATGFSVNGGEARLRLVVQDLDDRWDEAAFGTDGTLYKSEAGGDWTYRGDDAEAYTDVFDVEAGEEDLEPLTTFLRWLEESSDEEFADGLADRLDVEAFATYLAFEDLIGNFDDIEGPGNNSYLRWDADAGVMTVVAWDHNLAFGSGFGGGPEGVEPPEGLERPEGFEPPEGMPEGAPPDGARPGARPGGMGGGMGGGMRGSNVLAERFRATPAFAELYDEAVERLQAELYDDGTAQDLLDTWAALLEDEAGDLVDPSVVADEADEIATFFDGHAADEAAAEESASG